MFHASIILMTLGSLNTIISYLFYFLCEHDLAKSGGIFRIYSLNTTLLSEVISINEAKDLSCLIEVVLTD